MTIMFIKNLHSSGVTILSTEHHTDDRGFFYESFNEKKFQDIVGQKIHFVQDNHSSSKKGVLRGLHYQAPPYEQGKLIRITRGCVYDVAVDIRKYSPTYGTWVGEYLSEDNRFQMWIPKGFAHGFYVVSEIAEFQYKCTDYYAPSYERGIIWNDSKLNIDWPVEKAGNPLISSKDRQWGSFIN